MKTFSLTALILLAAATASEIQPLTAHAQQAQSVIGPSGATAVAPASGGTENLSVTNGSRTSLSVGNSTSFGASTNLSLSSGLVGVGRSALVPATATVTSAIGTTGSTTGVTKINISNLTAKGGGTVNPAPGGGIGSGTTINSTEGQFASGDALIDGMNATVTMSIGATETAPDSQASFFAIVHPNLTPGSACSPTVDGTACTYAPQNELVSGNAAASANLSTQTNIDIQANSFTQTFAQSF
jgi:hypothetical protein